MSTPLREPRDLRRVAPFSTQGGRDDNDIAAERAAAEHTATAATATVASTKPAGAATRAKPRSAAWRRAAYSAIDAGAERASQHSCSTIDESAIIAGYGAARAVSASTASAESSRRANSAERTALGVSLLGGAVMSTPPPSWRITLATQQVNARHKPAARLTRMKAIERLEWQIEELLVRDVRRISRQHLMTLMMGLPIFAADVDYILSGGARTDRVLDRCFELMGEDRNDSIHDERAIRRA